MKRRVLFLGAGFSAPFGHPVMDGFLSAADVSPHLSDDEKDFLGRLTLDARRANSFLESSPTNLEDILSYAVMSDRLGIAGGELLSPQVTRILGKIYGAVENAPRYWQECEKFESFYKKVQEGDDQVSVITTNYDINLEASLYWANNRARLPISFERIDASKSIVGGNLYEETGIPVFKLHGSVNWYLKDDSDELQVLDQVGRLSQHFNNRRHELWPLVFVPQRRPEHDPLIVPPSFLKPELSTVLKSSWVGAAKVLSRAQEVIFVGYSFPDTDTEMAYFLAHSMANNSQIRRILIIDKRAQEIVQRLRGDGSRYGSHFRELLTPVEADWRSAEIG